MATEANSKLCQTSEMKHFSQVVTSFIGKLRILPNVLVGAFCKNIQKLISVHYLCKNFHLHVWLGSEYAPELAFKIKNVLFLNQFEHQV